MRKFDISKIAEAKWIGYVAAGVAALAAFSTSMQEREKEKTIKNLVERVSQLENK